MRESGHDECLLNRLVRKVQGRHHHCCQEPDAHQIFVWGVKHRSKCHKIKVEGISDITVKFLEVRVWKHGSRFVTGPEFKPTSLWQPLGADSAHAPHCHMSWPAARLTMSRALSGTPAIFQKAKQELINRFTSHVAPEPIIKNLRKIDGLAAIRRGSKFDGIWLVVGFHPVVCRNLRRAIVRFQASSEMQECYEWAFSTKCPRIRIGVEKRHAAPQVHHLQDVQADREHRASESTPLNGSN